MKTFALKFAKLSKINGQTFVATETDRYLPKLKMSNLPKMCFPFLISLFPFLLQFPTQKKVKKINTKFP